MARGGIVVVGHGAAGLCAALSAKEAARERGSAIRVIVVERAPEASCGGNSRWSPANLRMRTPEAMDPGFADDIVAQSGGKAERAYFERLAAEAPATARWLQGKGIEFHSPPYYLTKGAARIQPVGGGAALFDALRRSANDAGVEFRYGCRLRRLALAGERIAGAQFDGEPATLEADAVILACGGFEGNGEMLREHFGAGADSLRPISPGTAFNDGAGIRAALQAGARRSGDWGGMHAEPVDARSHASAPVVLVYPYGIVVDRDGRRFFDEGAGLVHETWETIRPHAPLFDSRPHRLRDPRRRAARHPGLRARHPFGAAAGPGRLDCRARGPTGHPGRVAERNGDGVQRVVHRRRLAVRRDARDGLASAPGLSPRKSNWARPLARAPFLAWPLAGAIAYTFGGIATDTDARVLGVDGPIRGLYAAGEITGHFHGTAPNAVAMLRALVFGRIAGAAAAVAQLPGG